MSKIYWTLRKRAANAATRVRDTMRPSQVPQIVLVRAASHRVQAWLDLG